MNDQPQKIKAAILDDDGVLMGVANFDEKDFSPSKTRIKIDAVNTDLDQYVGKLRFDGEKFLPICTDPEDVLQENPPLLASIILAIERLNDGLSIPDEILANFDWYWQSYDGRRLGPWVKKITGIDKHAGKKDPKV